MITTTLRASFKLAALASVLLASSACANPPKDEAQAAAQQETECIGESTITGLATPETAAAIKAHEQLADASLDELFKGVASGDTAALIELGVRYGTGKDVPQDAVRGAKLIETAARRGNAVAMYFLGTAYANGAGVEKNDTRAAMLWEEAAKKGYPQAQYWFAMSLMSGRGGFHASWCAAHPFLEKAAEQGMSEAAFMVGAGFHSGEFGKIDYETAASWYRKAIAVDRHLQAQYNLRVLIERHGVAWQEGDPGKPPAPKAEETKPEKEMKLRDTAADNVG